MTYRLALACVLVAAKVAAQTSQPVPLKVLPPPVPPASLSLKVDCQLTSPTGASAPGCYAPATVIVTVLPVSIPPSATVLLRNGPRVIQTWTMPPYVFTWTPVPEGEYLLNAAVQGVAQVPPVVPPGEPPPVVTNPADWPADTAWVTCLPPAQVIAHVSPPDREPGTWAADCVPEAGPSLVPLTLCIARGCQGGDPWRRP